MMEIDNQGEKYDIPIVATSREVLIEVCSNFKAKAKKKGRKGNILQIVCGCRRRHKWKHLKDLPEYGVQCICRRLLIEYEGWE